MEIMPTILTPIKKEVINDRNHLFKIICEKGIEFDSIIFKRGCLTEEYYRVNSDYILIPTDDYTIFRNIEKYFKSTRVSKKDIRFIGTYASKINDAYEYNVWYIGGLAKKYGIRLRHNKKEDLIDAICNYDYKNF